MFLLSRIGNVIEKDTVTEEPISPEALLAIACIDLLTIPGNKIVFVQHMLVRGEVAFRGTQRGYSSKPPKHSIVERILVFKRYI